MLKLTNFSLDTFFYSVATMGYTYLDLFSRGIYRIFNWLLELFDHKIVPKPPVQPGVDWTWWKGPSSHTWAKKAWYRKV